MRFSQDEAKITLFTVNDVTGKERPLEEDTEGSFQVNGCIKTPKKL